MTRFTIFLSAVGLCGAVGCGSVAGKTPDLAMTGGSDLAVAAGSDMATAADMAMAGDMAMAAGGDMAHPPVSSCTVGVACQNGNGNGVCDGVNCNACVADGDCSLYGAGTLCLSGVCTVGACRTPSDCGGMPCTNNQCVGCQVDSDCTTANQICNTATHACVTNASCGASADNTACPVNGSDVCCSATCVPGTCCGSGNCTVVTANDGTCTGGICQLKTCSAPPGTIRYVDPTAAAGGNGSMGCPYTRISPAAADLAAAGGTVIVKSGSANTFAGTLAVAAGVNITGGDASFAACAVATCASGTWPTITETNNVVAFNYTTAGDRKLGFLKVVGVGAATSTFSGIHISAATVTMNHVAVSGFQQGIYVGTAGSAIINAGVSSNANGNAGLYVDDAGAADIELQTGDDITGFDNNVKVASTNGYGIFVSGSGKLKINGPTTGNPLIGASSNQYGVRFFSSSAGNTITGLHASANSADGLYLYAKSILKVRSSYFVNSTGGNGVHVVANGTNVANGFTGIDFGADYAKDPGNNNFGNNSGGTGFCIDKGVALIATNDSLGAQGNTWQTNLTCGATNPGQLHDSGSCVAGADVSDDCTAAIKVANCSVTSCTPQ